jgi:membrane-associated protease RseP (regulator of RpoE activity)
MGLLLFGVVIMLTIGVHEYGHYLAMIRNGVKVIAFQINVGPTLKAWTLKNGTVFSIRLIPIGGLARPVEEGLGGIEEASRWARFKIYVAGMVMNCLLAMAVLLVMLYGFGAYPKIPEMPYITHAFKAVLAASPVWMRIPIAAFYGSFGLWLSTPVMLWTVFSNAAVSAGNAIVGPVGIAHLGSQIAQGATSPADFAVRALLFLWLINVAVAQMNLLPIPALDGGRIAMLPFERWLSKKAQKMLIGGSVLLLFAFVLYATYHDILRWIGSAM